MTRPFKHDSALSALPPVIGIVASQLLNPYQQKMLDEVTRQLNVRGAITVLLSADSEEALTALIRQAKPLATRGLILLPGNRITDTCNLPVLEIDAEPELQADARRAGEVTSELLLAEGHQRFGFMQSQPVESAQKQGYSTALQAAGRVLNAVLTSEADDRDGAYQAMMDYLKKTRAADRIQALFCESEEARSSTWHLTSWSPDIRQIMGNALDRWLGLHAVSSQVQGQLARRHSHFGKIAPGEMSACGCAFRH